MMKNAVAQVVRGFCEVEWIEYFSVSRVNAPMVVSLF